MNRTKTMFRKLIPATIILISIADISLGQGRHYIERSKEDSAEVAKDRKMLKKYLQKRIEATRISVDIKDAYNFLLKHTELTEVQFRVGSDDGNNLLVYFKLPDAVNSGKPSFVDIADTQKIISEAEIDDLTDNLNIVLRNNDDFKKIVMDIDELEDLLHKCDSAGKKKIDLYIGIERDHGINQPLIFIEIPPGVLKRLSTATYVQAGSLCPPPRTSSCQ